MTAGPVGYDAELARYAAVLREAWAVQPHDRVLDVGCGAGQTTREAARQAHAAVGVDVSARAIERARALARDERLGNVTFECADAQTHGFAPGSFDLAISRFGTMFFADPVAAFANIGRALRPDGRLAMLVWQARERNEWDVVIRRALGAPPGGEPDPFTLADPAAVEAILRTAGFAGIDLADVAEPIYFGADTTAALAWVRGFTCTTEALNRLDPPAAAEAVSRLRDALEAYRSDAGVWFPSRAWLVTAHRATDEFRSSRLS